MADRTDLRPTPSGNAAVSRRVVVDDIADHESPTAPVTPGGSISPQAPGARPDRSNIPGHGQLPVPPPLAPGVRRPLTQYGTAQEIMGVYAPKPGEAMEPARFEQATASWEEVRKAYPAQLPAQRPGPGYALSQGEAIGSESQEIGGPSPAALAPDSGTAEAEAEVPAENVSQGDPMTPAQSSDPGRSASEVLRDLTMGGGQLGTSRWQDASPASGDAVDETAKQLSHER